MTELFNKIKILIKLARPLNVIQALIAALIGYWLVEGGSIIQFGAGVAVVLSYIAAGNAINDYFDYKIDKVNNPDRVLPAGEISKQSVLIFAILGFLAGMVFTVPILNYVTGIISITTVILLILYTPVFKQTVLLGNLVVSIILGSTFIFITGIYKQPEAGLIPALLAFGFNFIREIIKDMEDIEGDRREGVETMPVKIGKKKTGVFVLGGIILAMLAIPLPYFLDIYGIYYLLTVLLTVEIPLAYILFILNKDISKQTCARISSILKYDMFFGLIAIFLGRF